MAILSGRLRGARVTADQKRRRVSISQFLNQNSRNSRITFLLAEGRERGEQCASRNPFAARAQAAILRPSNKLLSGLRLADRPSNFKQRNGDGRGKRSPGPHCAPSRAANVSSRALGVALNSIKTYLSGYFYFAASLVGRGPAAATGGRNYERRAAINSAQRRAQTGRRAP